ncbi:MAG: hypothetical protein E7285_00635 [Lachnospiraceae bacterium]|nr:hypothetical protein [Lachnospiraceae bacterium]
MIEKKIRVRKEVVRCDICKQPKVFWYLSDFSYGQRLVYFDNNINLALINLLEDEIFLEYADMVKNVLKEYNISCSSDDTNTFIDKSFGAACDTMYGKSVDFSVGQKRCLHCGSTKFEKNMIEPESIIVTELPVVAHEKWKMLDYGQKERIILDELKKVMSVK